MNLKKNNLGISKVELLVVLAVIALVGVLAAVMVNSARERSRDYKRLNDINEIQIALEQHFNEKNEYPGGEFLPLGDAGQSACLSSEGFQGNCSGDPIVFMSLVPSLYDKGLQDLSQCGNPARTAYCYTVLSDGQSYAVSLEFERDIPERGIQKGINCAIPTGIRAGACFQEQ